MCLKSIVRFSLIISCLITNALSQFEEIATAKEIFEGAKTGVEVGKKFNELLKNGCVMNDQCFENPLSINNLCCSLQCCNAVTYIFRNE